MIKWAMENKNKFYVGLFCVSFAMNGWLVWDFVKEVRR